MKISAFILCAACLVAPVFSQSPAANDSGDSAATAASQSFVAVKLGEMKQINEAKLKTDAKYFILLSSASWCGACREEAPDIVRTYKSKIAKDKDVELVLFSSDSDEDKALAWAKQEKMTYPIMLDKGKYGTIPGYAENRSSYIPHALIVDRDGKLVANAANIQKASRAIVDADGKTLAKGGVHELITNYKKYCK